MTALAMRLQAQALKIEARAKERLADEYDAAQDRGQVRRPNNEKTTSIAEAVSVADLGLSHKEIHEARRLRDAERADPGDGGGGGGDPGDGCGDGGGGGDPGDGGGGGGDPVDGGGCGGGAGPGRGGRAWPQ
jgi:hypothetical protein